VQVMPGSARRLRRAWRDGGTEALRSGAGVAGAAEPAAADPAGASSWRGQRSAESYGPGDVRAAAMPQDKARYEPVIREKRARGG